jgi:hypothetical protein
MLKGQTVWSSVCELETHEPISNLLIQAGADKHAFIGDMRILYRAAADDHTTAVRLLFRQGVNPSIKTAFNWAPLVRTKLNIPLMEANFHDFTQH